MKQCARKECRREYPATTEHFHRSKFSNDGLDFYCKYCRRKINKPYESVRGIRHRGGNAGDGSHEAIGAMQLVPGRAEALMINTARIRSAIGK